MKTYVLDLVVVTDIVIVIELHLIVHVTQSIQVQFGCDNKTRLDRKYLTGRNVSDEEFWTKLDVHFYKRNQGRYQELCVPQ